MVATDRQRAFIERLIARGAPAPARDLASLTKAEASALIDTLLAATPKPAPAPAPTVEPGMYLLPDGTIFKVQKAKDSDRVYAKRLQPIGGRRLTEEDAVVQFEFVYERGALRFIRPEHRMSLTEAKAFGIRYGVCCVCGITLVDAKSVANGIGPVCARRV